MFSLSVAPSQFAKNMLRYRTDLNGAMDEGVKAMATIVRNEIRKEFQHTGSGRLYPSRKARAVRRLTVEAVALGNTIRTGADATGSKLSKRALAQRRQRFAGVSRRLLKASKRAGSTSDLHQASAAGESPAQDVGTIVAGIQAGVTDGERRVGNVGKWGGWQALDDGRGRVKGQRPFMERGLAKARPKLAGVNVRIVRARLGTGG